MKKIYILAAIALIAGVSCTKQVPVTDNSPDVAIAFSPITHKAGTKALITGATYPTNHNFNVWSVFSQNDLAFGDLATASNYSDFIGTGGGAGAEFTHAGTAPNDYWKGNGTAYYWPRAGKLSFVAFSPSDVDATYTWTTKTFAKAAYTINQAKDLMYSDITPNKTRNDFDTSFPYDDLSSGDTGFGDYKGVNILFHHTQSLVQFKVVKENTASNETITVTQIALVNPYVTGDLAATHSAFNAGGVTWSNYDNETASVVFSTTATEVPDIASSAVNVPASAGTGNDFIVLPQALDHTASNKKVQVAVSFTSKVGSVTSPVSTLNINLSDGYVSSAGDHTQWEPNKRYIYTIKFVGTEIILDPKVVDYDEVNVTLPELSNY